MSNWIGEAKRLVVAAACRIKYLTQVDGQDREEYLVFVGVRHFDHIMRAQMDAVGVKRFDVKTHFEQGFIDNRYCFIDRKEALRVAMEAGQINRYRTKTDPQDELFSEDLY